MLKNISSKTNSRIIFLVYPLAPKYTYMDSYPKLLELYKQLLKEYDSKDIIIMSDSSGGGLALGFSMYLRDNKIDVPNKLILLSPWIDLDMTNMEAKIYEKLDPMLSILSLKVSGFVWVGGNKEELQNSYVSPIFGKFNDLPYIVTFVVTHELFYPDLVKLDNILNEEKLNIKV